MIGYTGDVLSFFRSTKTAPILRTFQNWENLDMQTDFLGVLNKHEWWGTGATMCDRFLEKNTVYSTVLTAWKDSLSVLRNVM